MYGPTPDGSLVKADPKELIRCGKYDQSVKALISYSLDEGLVLVLTVYTNEEYETLVKYILTYTNSSTIDHITKSLCPPVFDGSKGYTTDYQRAALTVGDIFMDCNAAVLNFAFNNGSFTHFFDVWPGIHVQDI